MQIINIFVALIVALGFWRKSGKETDKKTKKASFTKTFILLLLTVALTFFYYKTYQVATFKYLISVEPFKGSFDKKRVYDKWAKKTLDEYIPHDRISKLIIFNSFSNKKTDYLDTQRDLYNIKNVGGIRVEMKLDNTRDSNIQVSIPGYKPSDFEELRVCYDVYTSTNSVPSLFPFSAYEESWNTGYFLTEKDSMDFVSLSKRNSREDGVFGEDYDKLYITRLSTKARSEYLEETTSSKFFNSLNFFSAADLSQSQFMYKIISIIPIDKLSVYFDIPIEVTSGNMIQDESDSRFFSIDVKQNNGEVNQNAFYHIKFPTLSNLQLIRSLILTTLLTALYSLLLTNLYYYCRKIYKIKLKKQSVGYKKKKEILLLWVPAGKIIIWTILILLVYLLLLSMFNNPFVFDGKYIIPYKILFFLFMIIYSILVCYILYVLYKRGIYLKKMIEKLKTYLKRLNNKRKDFQRVLLSKYANHSHHRKDGSAD